MPIPIELVSCAENTFTFIHGANVHQLWCNMCWICTICNFGFWHITSQSSRIQYDFSNIAAKNRIYTTVGGTNSVMAWKSHFKILEQKQ